MGVFTASAGVITFAGADQDLGPGWRTATVPNTISSNGILGSDGWYVVGNQGSTLMPAYITSMSHNGSVFGGNGSYELIDNPNTTPGLTPSEIISGTLNPFPGTGSTTVDFTFTFGSSIPAEVELGLMVDNLDIAAYNPSSVQVIEVGGPAASPIESTTTPIYNDRDPDWLLFDIQPEAGKTYQVVVGGGVNGCACLGAVSFDSTDTITSSVPEPSSFALEGVGLVGLAALVMRRRRFLQFAPSAAKR